MTDITLVPITSGYNLSKINDNFDKVEDVINNDVLHVRGDNNTMYQDLDLNGNSLLNVSANPNEPGSLVTIEVGDARWYNVSGDTLTGPMNVNGQPILGLREPVGDSEPVRKVDLDYEIDARVAGDINLQEQLNGVNPPMGSAFSEISWHSQLIANSIAIPDNVNAWSFGPTMSIGVGQVVEIGEGSFWTIANGATTGAGTLNPEIPSPLDMGELP